MIMDHFTCLPNFVGVALFERLPFGLEIYAKPLMGFFVA
jgi:hypothetical protein